jgi:long-chain acyl-CoA synthetase
MSAARPMSAALVPAWQVTDPAVLATRPWAKGYPEGVKLHIDYPVIPLHGLLLEAASTHPGVVATSFMGAKLLYKEVVEQAGRLATALAAFGIKKGDRVAIILPNLPQAVIAYYGISMAGGVAVEFNPLYVEREMEFQLSDCGAKAAVVLDLLYPRVAKVRERTKLENVIVTGIQDGLAFPLNLLYPIKAKKEKRWVNVTPGPGVHRWKEVLAKHPNSPPRVEVDPKCDPAILQYTGGTTGVPKGAMLTHYNLVANALQVAAWVPDCQRGKERILGVLPLFHVYGMTCIMNLGTALASTQILQPRFIIDDVLKAIAKEKPTLFPGAPTMYVGVINHPKAKEYDLRSIRACISGSAPLPVEVQTAFERITQGKLVEGYGLTEASPVTHANPIYGKNKIGTIGLPFPDTDCAILDLETGERELGPGEIGELAIRGPQVMLGYWNRPDENAKVFKNGWLLTGDIAKVDEEGYFTIVDRKKDMIIAGGFNIYPREIEEVLYTHPKVQEAAAVGIPDEYRGESVKVYLVLKQGETLTAEEVVEFCRKNMAKYKVPRAVEFRVSLPKTIVGKVLRRLLLEEELKQRAANDKTKESSGP